MDVATLIHKAEDNNANVWTLGVTERILVPFYLEIQGVHLERKFMPMKWSNEVTLDYIPKVFWKLILASSDLRNKKIPMHNLT
jgi:hypothetical protein